MQRAAAYLLTGHSHRGRIRTALDRLVLALYGVVAAYAFGLVLNLWFWPFGISSDSRLAFVPGESFWVNARHFWAFHVSSSLGFDTIRAVSNVVLLMVVGRPVLAALRRAARRAAFGETGQFRD